MFFWDASGSTRQPTGTAGSEITEDGLGGLWDSASSTSRRYRPTGHLCTVFGDVGDLVTTAADSGLRRRTLGNLGELGVTALENSGLLHGGLPTTASARLRRYGVTGTTRVLR